MTTTILFDRPFEGAYRITLDRPDRLNAFNSLMHEEFAAALSEVENDPSTRVLLITGKGRAFCAGQDLADRNVDAGPLDLGQALGRSYNPLIRRLVSLPVPVLCAVNGVAAGAGVNLAAACDITVAKKSSKFVQAFASIGLVPDTGGTWHLPRRMGQARALGFALLGEPLSAEKAEAWGLIWKVFEDDAFDSEVDALLRRLVVAPTYSLGMTKRLIRGSSGASLDESLDLERETQRSCGFAHDYAEGVSAFKQKREPRFDGKNPP